MQAAINRFVDEADEDPSSGPPSRTALSRGSGAGARRPLRLGFRCGRSAAVSTLASGNAQQDLVQQPEGAGGRSYQHGRRFQIESISEEAAQARERQSHPAWRR